MWYFIYHFVLVTWSEICILTHNHLKCIPNSSVRWCTNLQGFECSQKSDSLWHVLHHSLFVHVVMWNGMTADWMSVINSLTVAHWFTKADYKCETRHKSTEILFYDKWYETHRFVSITYILLFKSTYQMLWDKCSPAQNQLRYTSNV